MVLVRPCLYIPTSTGRGRGDDVDCAGEVVGSWEENRPRNKCYEVTYLGGILPGDWHRPSDRPPLAGDLRRYGRVTCT